MSQETAFLVRREDNVTVKATLLDGLNPADLVLVERVWSTRRQEMMQSLLADSVPRSAWPQSLHWDWGHKARDLQSLAYHGWAIEYEKQFQGVMLVELASHFADLHEDRGKPLLYLEYLEAAPWNWKCDHLSQLPQYKGVGQVLFHKAVEQSRDEGFHGRVGLHALPQAEGFYEQACGMTRFGQDPNKEGLVYFELSRTAAAKRLEKEE